MKGNMNSNIKVEGSGEMAFKKCELEKIQN